jgi:hypothetical protein
MMRRQTSTLAVVILLMGALAGRSGATSPTNCERAWRTVSSPNTPGETISQLLAVDSVAADDVWSVGMTYLSGPRQIVPLIEHWDGREWSIVDGPELPVGSGGGSLSSVSALSASDVWAAGSYNAAGSGKRTLIVHWDGEDWSIIPSPNASGPNVSPNQTLFGITAVSAEDAWAVGHYAVLEPDLTGTLRSTSKTMVQHWDGSSWSIVESPNPARPGTVGSFLLSVDAASANDVWAVGRYDTAVGAAYENPIYQTLIQHWDGTSWSTVSSPNRPGHIDYNHLLDVSVTSPDDVWAVGISGVYTGGFGSIAQTLIEHWDGQTWSIIPSPNPGVPGLGQGNWLYGVSGSAADEVWAVGLSATATEDGQQALIAHWDGTGWSATPGEKGRRDALVGVEAVSTADVWAVGGSSPLTGTPLSTLVNRYSDHCTEPGGL